MRPTSGDRTSIFPAGVCAVNSRPLKAQREFLRGDVGRALQAIGQRALREALQPRGVGIVRVDHRHVRRARAGAFKKQPLGGEIFLECLVVIEMVARQIRENRHREMAAQQRSMASA